MSSAQVLSGLLLFLTASTTASTEWQCGEKYCFSSDYQVRTIYSLEEADRTCRHMDQNSWLLEIYDEKVQEALSDYIKTHPILQSHQLLLNLIRRGGEWRWLDHTKFDEHLSSSNLKVKLFNNDPFATLRNMPYRGIYGPTYVTTLLQNYMCSFQGSCKKHSLNGARSLSYKGKCYANLRSLKKGGINWFQAENNCYKNGGSLAVFSHFSPAELQQVFRRFTRPMANYWVGLVKHIWEWRHSDSISNYTNWYTGYPYPPLIKVPAEKVFTTFDYSNGGIWTDKAQAPVAPIVCMKARGNILEGRQKRETESYNTTTSDNATTAQETTDKIMPTTTTI